MNNQQPTTNNQQQYQGGFTLFIAIIATGTLLLIAAGMANLAVRQDVISTLSQNSQHAFYAADAGMECALYWDVKNPDYDWSAFSPSQPSQSITCNGESTDVGGSQTSNFEFTLLPDPYCVAVTVSKTNVGSTVVTTIESKGYNTCDPLNPRRVERAVRATHCIPGPCP